MSYADILFKQTCEDIITNGTSTEGQEVRPVWPDTGEKAYTIKQFGISHMYDLRKEFPALTFRKTYIRSAFDEILWIYQRKSNKIKDLNSSVWDEWADTAGTIGKAYGYQVAQVHKHHVFKGNDDSIFKEFKKEVQTLYRDGTIFNRIPDIMNIKYPSMALCYDFEGVPYSDLVKIYKTHGRFPPQTPYVCMDQMDALLWELTNTPFSRRMKLSLWNPADLLEMKLQPCCYDCTFNVTDEGGDKLVLNLVMNQRSQDMLAANNWNTVQYALLLMVVAQCVGMVPGKFMHNIVDCHIYDRHVPIVKELIQRPMYDAPKVELDPDIHNFYEFTKDSIEIYDYQAGEQITNIPIAV